MLKPGKHRHEYPSMDTTRYWHIGMALINALLDYKAVMLDKCGFN